MFKSARKCPSFQLLISVFLVAILVLLGISTVSASSASPTTWVKLYGGSLDDSAAAIVQTGGGGYTIAGSTISFGTGKNAARLIKTDGTGVIPEFPTGTPLLILLFVVTVVTIVCERSLIKTPVQVGTEL